MFQAFLTLWYTDLRCGAQMPEIDYVVSNLTTGDYGDLRSSGSIGGPTICCNWYNYPPVFYKRLTDGSFGV